MTTFIRIVRILGLLIAACGVIMSVLELFDVCEHASSIMILCLRNPMLRVIAASSNLPNLIEYIIKKIRKEEVEL